MHALPASHVGETSGGDVLLTASSLVSVVRQHFDLLRYPFVHHQRGAGRHGLRVDFSGRTDCLRSAETIELDARRYRTWLAVTHDVAEVAARGSNSP
jgi:hypothetical protein